VLIRYRERDFAALEHWDGVSPAWPFGYEVLEPWYGRAEQLFEVRGVAGQDPTEPPHSTSYTSTRCRMNRPSQRIALGLRR
jgi:choline dehydrogenase-like flavoprotein